MYNHIIYKLIDPITFNIHYIGYTSNYKSRLSDHYTGKKGTDQKKQWIQNLKEQGLKPIMEVVAVYPDPEMLPKAEEVWYNAFIANGCELYQDPSCVGGKFPEMTEELKLKISASKSGKKHSEEWNKNISLGISGEKHPFFGKNHTTITKQKQSKAHKGKTWKLISGKRVWLEVSKNIKGNK